jgi:hypothetical protein
MDLVSTLKEMLRLFNSLCWKINMRFGIDWYRYLPTAFLSVAVELPSGHSSEYMHLGAVFFSKLCGSGLTYNLSKVEGSSCCFSDRSQKRSFYPPR